VSGWESNGARHRCHHISSCPPTLPPSLPASLPPYLHMPSLCGLYQRCCPSLVVSRGQDTSQFCICCHEALDLREEGREGGRDGGGVRKEGCRPR